jgi:hypothetical protein
MFIIDIGMAAAAIEPATLGNFGSPKDVNNFLRIIVSKSANPEVITPGTPGGDGINFEPIDIKVFAISKDVNTISVKFKNVDRPVIAFVILSNCLPIEFNDTTKPFLIVIIFLIVGLFGLGQPLANTVFNIGGICLGSSANEKDPKFVI